MKTKHKKPLNRAQRRKRKEIRQRNAKALSIHKKAKALKRKKRGRDPIPERDDDNGGPSLRLKR